MSYIYVRHILDSARYCICAQNKIMGLLEEIIFYDVTALLSTLKWHALSIKVWGTLGTVRFLYGGILIIHS